MYSRDAPMRTSCARHQKLPSIARQVTFACRAIYHPRPHGHHLLLIRLHCETRVLCRDDFARRATKLRSKSSVYSRIEVSMHASTAPRNSIAYPLPRLVAPGQRYRVGTCAGRVNMRRECRLRVRASLGSTARSLYRLLLSRLVCAAGARTRSAIICSLSHSRTCVCASRGDHDYSPLTELCVATPRFRLPCICGALTRTRRSLLRAQRLLRDS